MSKTFTASTLTATIVRDAKAVIKALESFDKVASSTADTIKSAMQDMVNAAGAANLKREEKSVKWLQEQVKSAFAEAVAIGMLEGKTVTEYAQGVARAFFHNVEWTPRLKNDPAMALPWGGAKGKKSSTAKSPTEREAQAPSKGAKVTKETAFGQAKALLASLRALNLDSVAADILDIMLEVEGFEETASV